MQAEHCLALQGAPFPEGKLETHREKTPEVLSETEEGPQTANHVCGVPRLRTPTPVQNPQPHAAEQILGPPVNPFSCLMRTAPTNAVRTQGYRHM